MRAIQRLVGAIIAKTTSFQRFIVDPKLQHGFRLGDCVVHPLPGLIERPDGSEHVQPKVMDVLVCLAERPGQVVERDELVDRVWGKTAVTDEVLTRCISELRHALGDSRDHPKYVQTIPKRGYRLVTAVEVLTTDSNSELNETQAANAALEVAIQAPQSGGLVLFFKDLKRRKVFKVAAAYAIVSWILLQVAQLVSDTVPFPPWAMKFAVALVIFGFPIAALCAWAFQITPEGKIIIDIPSGDQKSGFGRRQADLFVISILSVSVGLLIYVLFISDIAGPEKSTDHEPNEIVADSALSDADTREKDSEPRMDATVFQNSIAVLRFVIIGDPKYRYISDGISEELLHRFSKLTKMFVASRTITWGLPDQPDLQTIRERLRVRYVLEGSVRSNGDQLRVTAQLIDTETGFHRWSESYDREVEDLFDIEDEVAVEVVNAVGVELSEEAKTQLVKRPTESIDAYILYLRGLESLRRPREEDTLAKSEGLFNEALDVDSRFVLAYAGLCEVNLARYRLSRNTERFEDAERACHRALTLDSSLKEVYAALGSLYRHSGQYENARAEFTTALELDPRYEEANYGLARAYQGLGRMEEAEKALRHSIELEPGYWGTHMAMGNFLHRAGRYHESVEFYRRVTELASDSANGYTNLGSALYETGDWRGAEEAWKHSIKLHPTSIGYLNMGTLFYYTERYDAAVAMYNNGIELAPFDHRLWGKLAAAQRYIPGAVRVSQTSYQKAIVLAEERLAINPESAADLAYLGAYYVNVEQFEEARNTIARALELAPENPRVHYFAAIMNIRINELDSALTELEKATELGYSRRLISVDPQFSTLRQQSRFKELVAGPSRSPAS